MYTFYYDETEHSRRITSNTVSSAGFYDGFIATIVGWNDNALSIEQKMNGFKEKHRSRQSKKGEIKSTTISNKEIQYGFATLKRETTQLIEDFLAIFDETMCLYIFSASKIEYIIRQLFSCYRFIPYVNVDAMIYTTAKAIVLHKPAKVLAQMGGDPRRLTKEILAFLEKCVEEDMKVPWVKQPEINAFSGVVAILRNYQAVTPTKIDWNYIPAFDGFQKYLKEKRIADYSLVIDDEHNTFLAAQEAGIHDVKEGNSVNYLGVQIADMMAGIIGKIMKALNQNLKYVDASDHTNRKLLNEKWFDLSEDKFQLYKQLHTIICKWDHMWYKTYAGVFSDDFVTFIALLDYFDQYGSAKEMKASNTQHNERFNNFVRNRLSQRF